MAEELNASTIAIAEALMDAAEQEDWEKIDTELVPLLRSIDGDKAAAKLLKWTESGNPNYRDAVATGLSACNIKDRKILKEAVEKMSRTAVNDSEKFPAGRAAMFLWKYRNDEELKNKIQTGIDQFKNRREIEDWKSELITNVDGIDELFGMVG